MTFDNKEVNTIFEQFEKHGFECYLVGGCVRNRLLGLSIKDYDFTTNATPEQVEQIFAGENVVETGLQHGTVTVVLNHIPFEITTYRIDGEYHDHRRPDSIRFSLSLTEDLVRRDFTMNSIAFCPKQGIVDVFGGQQDIKEKVIRCNGIPDKRFAEDALRILRAIRFASVLGFRIEKETKESMFRNKDLLKHISVERVAAELNKTVCGKWAHDVILEYIDILGVVIPELLPMKNFPQNNPNHVYDVLTHTCVALDGAPEDLSMRLAILFHDMGKPASYTEKDGIGHFYGHAAVSAQLAQDVFSRLKYDNKTKREVVELIRIHDLDLQASEKYVRKLILKYGFDFVKNLIIFQRADNRGQGNLHLERIEKFDRINKILRDLEQNESVFSLKHLALNGNDLLALGYRGAQIGELLQKFLYLVATGKLPNDKKVILESIKENLTSKNETINIKQQKGDI